MIKKIATTLIKLRKAKPLVLNLTNYVTMDFMANALLAIGAAPIMTTCDQELEELIKICNCVHINIGTLDSALITRCNKAIKLAKNYKKPIVLDPVGAGASMIRTNTAKEYIKHMDIVKGNASEIIALGSTNSKTRGVDSIHCTATAKTIARKLAKTYQLTVVVTGPTDFIAAPKKEVSLPFGSELMPLVTGMGCTLTAVIAAFRGINADSFTSAVSATSYYGLCGQLAAQTATLSGTFRTAFIDELHAANFAKMQQICET